MSNLPPLNTRKESFADGLTIRVDEGGNGRPMLVLHGGGGPHTMLELSKVLAKRGHVLLPTHPGFAGEPRPEWFDSIDDLALAYLALLEQLDLHDVLVIGSSMGGWIASAMALHDTTRRLSGLVLVDAGGIQVEGYPIPDVSTLKPDELAALSYHNPAAFRIDPSTITPEQAQARAANVRALYIYDQGQGMGDPRLKRHLSHVSIPVLVVWGESDRVILPEYGRAYAQAFPNARFELIPEAGHLPQFEQPQRLLNLVLEFANSTGATV
ncbi:alpha/beta hydrolase [Dictyobacter vulcani]|uniref:Alpha/beta hydrolase n=1 Tax=Dictyobacter vulcani TaxID=2607529 RepID=A0A5J4KNX7_9CHLR|nr:alpha/beta hydrolase [Dictyobacter vulcani]GER91074.1 alpha/beta hydrolase [Dictyobacter vulcani]